MNKIPRGRNAPCNKTSAELVYEPPTRYGGRKRDISIYLVGEGIAQSRSVSILILKQDIVVTRRQNEISSRHLVGGWNKTSSCRKTLLGITLLFTPLYQGNLPKIS